MEIVQNSDMSYSLQVVEMSIIP